MLDFLFQESLVLMKNLLCWDSEDIKNLKLNSRKVDENDPLSLETRQLLEKLMEPDFKVYNHFKNKFFKAVEQFGEFEMKKELEDLDRVNTEITEKCDFRAADNNNLRDTLMKKVKNISPWELQRIISMREKLFIALHCYAQIARLKSNTLFCSLTSFSLLLILLGESHLNKNYDGVFLKK